MQEERTSGKIGINAVWNGILSLSSILFPIITFPYVSRTLGVDVNGAIAYSNSVVNYFSLFAMLGLSTYGVKACAQVKNDREALSHVVQELLIISSCAAIVVLAVLYASLFFVPNFSEYRWLLLIYSANIVCNVLGMNWMYQGIEKFRLITTRSIFFKILSIILMFLFVRSPEDGILYAVISVIATAGGNLYSFCISPKYISFRKTGKYNFKQHLKPLLVLFATVLAVNVYSQLDTVMLGWISGDYATGIYYVSVKIKTILLMLISSFSIVIMSRTSFIGKDDKENLFPLLRKSYSLILLLSLSITVFFFVFSSESILLLSGSEYIAAKTPMRILLPTIFFSAVSQVIGNQYSVAVGKEKNLMIAVVVGAVVDLVLNILLIPRYSYVGAAIGTLVAEVVQCVLQMILAREMVGKVFSVKELCKTGVGTLLSVCAVYPIKRFVGIENVFWALVVYASVFFLVYFLSEWGMRQNTCVDFSAKLKNRFQRKKK